MSRGERAARVIGSRIRRHANTQHLQKNVYGSLIPWSRWGPCVVLLICDDFPFVRRAACISLRTALWTSAVRMSEN